MRIKREVDSHKIGIIGKIKIGEKSVKGYPKALDYFRFKSQFPRYEEQAREIYGKTPKQLKVTFASDDPNENCIQRMELRDSSGKLAAYTDLQTLWVANTAGYDKVSDERIEKGGGIEACMKALEKKYKGEFFECLYLRVMLLGFPVIGQWEIYTKGSKTSIQNIIDVYDMVQKNAGRVQFVPFTINVDLVKSNRTGVNRKYPVISLFADLSIQLQEAVKTLGNNLQGLVTEDKVNRLQAPDTSTDIEDAQILDNAG